jgi:hypothetical protein
VTGAGRAAMPPASTRDSPSEVAAFPAAGVGVVSLIRLGCTAFVLERRPDLTLNSRPYPVSAAARRDPSVVRWLSALLIVFAAPAPTKIAASQRS